MEKIKYTKYGLACRIGDNIYLNYRLKQHAELFTAILSHEKAHSSGFTLKDIKSDLSIKELKDLKGEYYKFILTNPSTWTMFIPFWKYEGRWVIDPSLIGIYLLGIALGGIIWQFI